MGDILKPCPFCGGEAWLYSGEGRNYDWHGVKCDGSGADVCPVFPDTTLLPSKTLAITAWNTRADAGCIAELVEAGRALLQFEGHMVWCGHGRDDTRPCVCGYLDAQGRLRATLAKVKGEAA